MRWTSSTALLASAALALGACASGRSPRACQADAECPANARCFDRTCAGNSAPVARIAAPTSVEAFALFSLDGSASTDPDPGDAVQRFGWRISSADAACAPPVVASTTALAPVRFGCPGRYEVTLVVQDGMGAESAPATATVDVVASTAPAAVVAGPDVSVAHRCAGTPLLCTTFDGTAAAPVGLSVTRAPSDPSVTIAWSATPPPGQGIGADRRVRFEPDASSPAPTVRIETDGVAISGDWVFTVEARDAAGVLGRADLRVSIGNAPPVVTGAPDPVTVPHSYEAATGRFLSNGSIAAAVVDPDGDPVQRTAAWHHAGDGGALFTGVDDGTALSVRIAVAFGAAADAAYLIGDGVSRSVVLDAVDVNGGATRQVWNVVVGNGVPLFRGPGDGSTPHAFDRAGSRYTATATVGFWVDPDGDPLGQVADTTDPVCNRIRIQDGQAVVECTLAYQGVPALGNFAGGHLIRQEIRDPWTAANAVAYPLQILDAPPAVQPVSQSVSVTCDAGASSTCCWWTNEVPRQCGDYATIFGPATTTFTLVPSDPEGDPVQVTTSPATTTAVVFPGEPVTVVATSGTSESCTQLSSVDTSVRVWDGALFGSANATLNKYCR